MSSSRSSPQNANELVSNRLTQSEKKLYLIFVVDSMTSNLALFSGKHKIKSAP